MILPTLAMMTLVATKLPHYVLPVFPWLALMHAGALETASSGAASRRDSAWLRCGVWPYGLVAVAVGVTFLAGSLRQPDLASARWPLFIAGSVVLAGAVTVVIVQWWGRFRRAAGVLLFGTLAWWVIVAVLVLPALESIVKPDTRLARTVADYIDADTPVALHGWYEPALHFYLGGRPIEHISSSRHLVRWAREPGPGLIITTRSALDEVELDHRPVWLREIGSERGISHVDGRRIELVALLR